MYILIKTQNNIAEIIDFSQKEDKKYLISKLEKLKRKVQIKETNYNDLFICQDNDEEIIYQILEL